MGRVPMKFSYAGKEERVLWVWLNINRRVKVFSPKIGGQQHLPSPRKSTTSLLPLLLFVEKINLPTIFHGDLMGLEQALHRFTKDGVLGVVI